MTRTFRLLRALAGTDLERFDGRIAAAGTDDGHALVTGAWHRSPLGPFADVMWIDPDGRRTLLAPSSSVADDVADLYVFDEVRVVEVHGRVTADRVELQAGPVTLALRAAPRTWRSWVFAARPRPLRRAPAWIALEDRLVAPLGPWLLGGAPQVRLAGTTPTGRREWYSIDDHRELHAGSVTIEGVERPLAPLRPDLGVGLSSFPTAPALVTLTTLIAPPPGRRPRTSTAGPQPAAAQRGSTASTAATMNTTEM